MCKWSTAAVSTATLKRDRKSHCVSGSAESTCSLLEFIFQLWKLRRGPVVSDIPAVVAATRTLQVGKVPEAQCFSHCNCFNSSISPVCGSNGITYLSACFAGCTSRNSQEPTGRSGSSITQVGAGFFRRRSCPVFLRRLHFVTCSSGFFFLSVKSSSRLSSTAATFASVGFGSCFGG